MALAVLTLIVGLPGLARAQQTGLFPLAPIRRQRVPCDQQDPTYKIHRYQYFGYHPTCWRPFPAGWGCPSPEAPDKAESFRKQKLEAGSELSRPGAEGVGPMEAQPELNRPPVPALPGGGRSPFETSPDAGRPDNAPQPRGGGAVVPSPFDIERTPPAGTAPGATPAGPRAGRDRPNPRPNAGDGPELSAPTAASGRTSGNRLQPGSNDDEVGARDEDGPVLALPIDIPPVDDSTSVLAGQPGQPPATAADAGSSPAQATNSAAPRRGILSGLFNNLGLNWTRRE